MDKKILIAPNSFKEVADADKVAELLSKYLKKLTSAEFIMSPISDGGDGFLNVCKSHFNLEILNYKIKTPFDESTFNCEVGFDKKQRRIFIESARVLGLKVIPKEKRHPLILSSKGMGDLLIQLKNNVEEKKLIVDEIFIGIGGTGTNDLGLGMCSQLGLELFDLYDNRKQVLPEYFYRTKKIYWRSIELPFKIKIIIDVDIPLLGEMGTTKIFGPQKGLSKGEINVIELGFGKIINLLKNILLEKSFNNLFGAGGGLAAGFYLFLNSDIIFAKEFIENILCLKESLNNIDVVITGEGIYDEQSTNGKGAGIIIDLATRNFKKVILCCGQIEDEIKNKLHRGIEVVELVSLFDSTAESINNFEKGIEMACKKIATII